MVFFLNFCPFVLTAAECRVYLHRSYIACHQTGVTREHAYVWVTLRSASFTAAGAQLPQSEWNGRVADTQRQDTIQKPSSFAKKPRVAWTTELHDMFVKAVTELGVDTAVPKAIMLVSVLLSAGSRFAEAGT